MAGIAGNEFGISEKRVTCPYNKSHVVPEERIAKHLVTCKKQHPDVELKICPFNATHHVRVEEFIVHIKNCKSKDVAEKAIYKEKFFDHSSLQSYSTKNVLHPDEEVVENWDSDDLPRSTYNPKLEALHKTIFRNIPCELGASGKKQWRKVEAERIARIISGTSIEDLEFPTAVGGVETIAEITKRDDTNEKPVLPMPDSGERLISKNLMRVDLSSTMSTKSENKKAANKPESNPSKNSLNSSPLAVNKGKLRRGKKNFFKLVETVSEISEIESIFASFSKDKTKPEKENVQPSF